MDKNSVGSGPTAPISSRRAQVLPTQLIIPGGPVAFRPHGHLPRTPRQPLPRLGVRTSRICRPVTTRSRQSPSGRRASRYGRWFRHDPTQPLTRISRESATTTPTSLNLFDSSLTPGVERAQRSRQALHARTPARARKYTLLRFTSRQEKRGLVEGIMAAHSSPQKQTNV